MKTQLKNIFLSANEHVASAVLMVKPIDFKFNIETAKDNEFMKQLGLSSEESSLLAINEYEKSVHVLRSNGILVISFDKLNYPQLLKYDLPDAVFPNNTFNTWADGKIFTYPMKNVSRQLEHQQHAYFWKILTDAGFLISNVENIEKNNELDAFEATGVLVIDRKLKRAYVSISQRATTTQVENWGKLTGYEMITFNSATENGTEIYHTNVILSVCDQFAIICKDVIRKDQQDDVLAKLSEGRKVIILSIEQTLKNFGCNCLEVRPAFNENSKNKLVMSQRASNCLDENQRSIMTQFVDIVALPINIIEEIGGGSARCMLAEIFNPLKLI